MLLTRVLFYVEEKRETGSFEKIDQIRKSIQVVRCQEEYLRHQNPSIFLSHDTDITHAARRNREIFSALQRQIIYGTNYDLPGNAPNFSTILQRHRY